MLRHLLIGGRTTVPRVRALHHRRDERLRRPQGPTLRGAACHRDRSRGLKRRSAHHELQRRGGHRGDGRRAPGDDVALGSGRRRARRRLDRGPGTTVAAHHVGHGRHLGRHRHRDRWPVHRGERPGYLDCRLSLAGLDDRHSHHRRRWRLHRASRFRRRVPGRAAQRRSGAGAGGIRPGRSRPDGH